MTSIEASSTAIWHGGLEQADAAGRRSGLAQSRIFAAAVLGDDESVRRFLARDPGRRPRPFSRSARPPSSPVFLELPAARSRANAGIRAPRRPCSTRAPMPTAASDPAAINSGSRRSTVPRAWRTTPVFTRLLLERGADPNDNGRRITRRKRPTAALKVLVEAASSPTPASPQSCCARPTGTTTRDQWLRARRRRTKRRAGGRRRCTTPSSATTISPSSNSCSSTARIRWRSPPVRSAVRRGLGTGPRSRWRPVAGAAMSWTPSPGVASRPS